MNVRKFGGLVVGRGETEAARIAVLAEHVVESRLVERSLAGRQHLKLVDVDIDADDLVSKLGHARGVGGAQIARSEDGDPATHLVSPRHCA